MKGWVSFRAKLTVAWIIMAFTGAPAYPAYDWIFQKADGSLTVVSEQLQGSTDDYDRYRVVIRPPGAEAEDIPMLLCLPKSGQAPYPVVILLHGHGGNKEWPVNLFATALAQIEIASLAYDLPDHGERNTGNGTFWDDFNDWERVTAGVTLSVTDGRWVADYLQARSDIEASKIACMGYSLGSYIGCILTDVENSIAGLVMNVGGTSVAQENYIKETYGMVIWDLHAGGYFPTTHAADINPRPAWMLNGINDTVILPSDSQALYDALQEPRRITWYDSGHSLPTPAATDEAVGYLQNLFASPDDLDLDGLTNGEEMATHNTRPLVDDTDDDGLIDGDEVNVHGTDPLDTDTDNDGLQDGDEVNLYWTEPDDPDTDDDTFSDYIETIAGSDPLDDQKTPSTVRVNFQPSSSTRPPGYCLDSGADYSLRGYGWQ